MRLMPVRTEWGKDVLKKNASSQKKKIKEGGGAEMLP